MGGWFITAASQFVAWQNKALQGLATATAPLVVIIMGYWGMRIPTLSPMAASLKSYWLYSMSTSPDWPSALTPWLWPPGSSTC
jgi:hypothetical protein